MQLHNPLHLQKWTIHLLFKKNKSSSTWHISRTLNSFSILQQKKQTTMKNNTNNKTGKARKKRKKNKKGRGEWIWKTYHKNMLETSRNHLLTFIFYELHKRIRLTHCSHLSCQQSLMLLNFGLVLSSSTIPFSGLTLHIHLNHPCIIPL